MSLHRASKWLRGRKNLSLQVGRPRNDQLRPRLENLEDRLVPSTLVWNDRGSAGNDSDNFNAVFGANAAAARLVVDQVLSDWQRALTALNQPGGGNSISINISVDPNTQGLGGGGGITSFD